MRHDGVLGRKVAGRFMVKRLLGEGGMASVYVAERDAEPREVALKIMDPALTSDRSFVRRFQREAKAASRVKHPNSVKIFEYGVEGRLSYIVMELLIGADLYALLERDGAISQWRAVRLLSEVCDALMVAHEMGIVHRDLKPENIMVIPDNTHPHGERVKVLDFGIAKVLDNDEGEPEAPPDSRFDPPSAITRAGTLVGTPAYMSPEQCGLLPVDTRSDIYTCGVLLYQLVTGRLPFEGETPLHTATLHIHAPLAAPSSVAPQIDRRLEALIMKALAKKPAERHQTARHLGASLRKLLPDIPDVSVGEGVVSRRQTSSMWPREAPRPPDPPSRPEPSLESARTLTSSLEVGPPPPVHLHQTPLPPRPPRPLAENTPAIPRQAAAYTPLELPPPDPDGELSTVTLVRPEQHPFDGPATPRIPERPPTPVTEERDSTPAMIREVKMTLRSANDFGLRASERRPDVHVPVSAPPPGEGAPPSMDLDFQGQLADSGAYGTPQESNSKRLVHTIRMQHTGPGPDPMRPPPARPREPSSPDSELAAFAATAKALPPMAGRMPLGTALTVPMPQPQPPVRPIAQVPPTRNDLPYLQMGMPLPMAQAKRGLLSGKLGMLIGFLAGMLITAALVALYLFLSR